LLLEGALAAVRSGAAVIGTADFVVTAGRFTGEGMRVAAIAAATISGGATHSALADATVTPATRRPFVGRIATCRFIERVAHADETLAAIGRRVALMVPLGTRLYVPIPRQDRPADHHAEEPFEHASP
jgi:hypothetical protein